MGKKIGLIIIISTVSMAFFIGFFAGNIATKKVVHVDLDVNKELPVIDVPPKYPFLEARISNYICSLSDELQIDSDLAVAILMNENPEFNPNVIHINDNGTNDLGLFQLNDKYCYTTFLKSYWDIDVEFNPYNWKHNTFIALHHIEWLQSKLKVQDDVIMAYNCGLGAVISGRIPDTTITYLSRTKNNITLLKRLWNDRKTD